MNVVFCICREALSSTVGLECCDVFHELEQHKCTVRLHTSALATQFYLCSYMTFLPLVYSVDCPCGLGLFPIYTRSVGSSFLFHINAKMVVVIFQFKGISYTFI
jgi:hypothetical protein